MARLRSLDRAIHWTNLARAEQDVNDEIRTPRTARVDDFKSGTVCGTPVYFPSSMGW